MQPSPERKPARGYFPTTAWTFIESAKDPADANYRQALGHFAESYWKPVFFFLRARGYPVEKAEDLTQDFFCRFHEKNWMSPASKERGRFRNFLLRVLVRFLSDQSQDRAPRQKAFEDKQLAISQWLTEEDRAFEPGTSDTPETVFMRRWAASVLRTVNDQLREQCEREGRAQWYAIFCERFDSESDKKSLSLEALAEKYSLSRDQVRYAIENVTNWFQKALRRELRDQVGSESEIDAEIRELMTLLAG
ncbi:MAG: hypothetical protein U1D30_08035 [Planctomycetota bacterium]